MEGKKVDPKLMLFTLILVLIVLLLFNFLLEKNRTDEIWNYKEITTAEDIMYQGKRVTDRETFYTLEKIITQYLNSYINVYNEDKIMYEDYYQFLTKNYKNYLSKKEYKQVAEKFLNKFYINIDSDYIAMDTTRVVKRIYELDNSVYVCMLEGNKSKETGYIAIQLNTTEAIFNIVYIE